MKKITKSIILGLALTFTLNTYAQNNRANLEASVTVIRALDINKISDLVFPEAVQGSGPHTVQPGLQEDRHNGSFKIQGEPGKVVHLLIPTNNFIKMKSSSGDEIVIERIILNEPFVTLDTNGKSTVFVGATREAISFNHSPGEYKGQFTITAIY